MLQTGLPLQIVQYVDVTCQFHYSPNSKHTCLVVPNAGVPSVVVVAVAVIKLLSAEPDKLTFSNVRGKKRSPYLAYVHYSQSITQPLSWPIVFHQQYT